MKDLNHKSAWSLPVESGLDEKDVDVFDQINSMLASINSLFDWLGWADCRVKSLKTQQKIFCPEEKELTKAEYLRLVQTAQQNGTFIWSKVYFFEKCSF